MRKLVAANSNTPSRRGSVRGDLFEAFQAAVSSVPPQFQKEWDRFLGKASGAFSDRELPDFIKEMMVEQAGHMKSVFFQMGACQQSQTLLSKSTSDLQESFFPEYKKAAAGLKAELARMRQGAAIAFSGRDEKLFLWCRAELEKTAHPLVAVLREKYPEVWLSAADQFAKLEDISTLLILHITCGDDMADNIQHPIATQCFSRLPFASPGEIKVLRQTLLDAEGDRFAAYFDVAVDVWNDAMRQLGTLFGEAYFNNDVKPRFLDLFRASIRSFEYSLKMNNQPHDPAITQTAILDNLAPNMMVQCFRFLEEQWVQKVVSDSAGAAQAADDGIAEVFQGLEEDLSLVNDIVRRSQHSASMANATATAPRELKENDVSNPIPFALNDAILDRIDRRIRPRLEAGESVQVGKTIIVGPIPDDLHARAKFLSPFFIEEFESFLVANDYKNHFLEQYHVNREELFDFLSLLELRRLAFDSIAGSLLELKQKHGLAVPVSDYSLESLAYVTIKEGAESQVERVRSIALQLKKYGWHVQLIDKFSEAQLVETAVQHTFFEKWVSDLEGMRCDALRIVNPALRKAALAYVEAWKGFLCMYLINKRAFDGTI